MILLFATASFRDINRTFVKNDMQYSQWESRGLRRWFSPLPWALCWTFPERPLWPGGYWLMRCNQKHHISQEFNQLRQEKWRKGSWWTSDVCSALLRSSSDPGSLWSDRHWRRKTTTNKFVTERLFYNWNNKWALAECQMYTILTEASEMRKKQHSPLSTLTTVSTIFEVHWKINNTDLSK